MVSETGGQSQLAGLAAVAIVILLLVFGASLLRQIPNAALGGVLLFVALRIVRVGQIVTIFRQSLGEFLLIFLTAAAIIVLPIEQGVGIGIALSLLHGIWSTTRARVLVFERVRGTSIWWPSSSNLPGEREPGALVVGFQAPLSFLNAYNFRHDILAALKSSPEKARLLVLEATGIVEIDFTAAQILIDLIRSCHADGVDFAMARLEVRPRPGSHRRVSASVNCWARIICFKASRRRSKRCAKQIRPGRALSVLIESEPIGL